MALLMNSALLVGLFFLLHTWGVKAQLKVEVEGRVEVSLGEDAEIPCLYTTDDGIEGLTIEWLYLGQGRRRHRIYLQEPDGRSEEPDTPFSGRIRVDVNGSSVPGQVVLTVLKPRLGDEVDFICRVRSLTYGNDEGVTQLRVFETPDVPTVEAEATFAWYMNTEPVKVATCEAKNGYPKPNITWFKDHIPLMNIPNQVSVKHTVSVGPRGLYSVTSVLSINVVKKDKDSKFYCEVNYQTVGGFGMMESNKTQILVQYPTDKVDLWVESPKGVIKTGDTVELQCHGNGNPQPIFTFRNNGVDGVQTELESQNNVLVLRDVSVLSNGLYECLTTDLRSWDEIVGNYTLTVHYLHPAAVVPEEAVVLQGEGINASCNALSSLDTHTVWTKNGVEVATGNILSLTDLTYDMAGAYECTVTVPNVVGMETSALLQLTFQAPESTESRGVIIAVIIICLLLLAVLGSVLYFLYKKGKICGRSSKQDLTKEKTSRDNIVVEMKSDNTEEAVLLSVNGDKKQ